VPSALKSLVVLGTLKGLHKTVLADVYTRRKGAIGAGIEQIPFVIEELESEVAALQHAMMDLLCWHGLQGT